ncbi:hypothetical protein COTS27_01210 [Spirochaetota bacterium]|nr:hypothetical protein COTS27_01210 [Spirochaetota bacterium]
MTPQRYHKNNLILPAIPLIPLNVAVTYLKTLIQAGSTKITDLFNILAVPKPSAQSLAIFCLACLLATPYLGVVSHNEAPALAKNDYSPLIVQASNNYLLIPMDAKQGNHLKAYGVTYYALSRGLEGKWLLGYRGGSFLLPFSEEIRLRATKFEVDYEIITTSAYVAIRTTILEKNMAEVDIKKAPRVAIYTPPNINPWADAVTLALTYAEIPYDTVYDSEVLAGKLSDYDWLHLHHEDFTGQFSKFWANYRSQEWFKEHIASFRREAAKAGYSSVHQHKKAVARGIRDAVESGLFLFAMCTATETIDISLATQNTDIVSQEIDGTPLDNNWPKRLDYTQTFAFEDFYLETSPYVNSFSDIDFNQVNNAAKRKEVSDFILFEFSAKIDPIPTLLTQNHNNRISGFYGQTTSFHTNYIKEGVTVLAYSLNDSARYITGKYGKGNFTFYGGHDPEDKHHYVGDQAPNMEFYKNSPGYRLILNNILFPSAKPPKKKT